MEVVLVAFSCSVGGSLTGLSEGVAVFSVVPDVYDLSYVETAVAVSKSFMLASEGTGLLVTGS
eukprot:scaffold224867_cov36-Prasinocladus_malaysianus.AAC.1